VFEVAGFPVAGDKVLRELNLVRDGRTVQPELGFGQIDLVGPDDRVTVVFRANPAEQRLIPEWREHLAAEQRLAVIDLCHANIRDRRRQGLRRDHGRDILRR